MRTVGSVSSLSIANVSGRASYILQSCNFYQLVNLHERVFGRMQAWYKLIKILYFFFGGGGSGGWDCSAQRFFRFSQNAMHEVLQEGFSKMSCLTVVFCCVPLPCNGMQLSESSNLDVQQAVRCPTSHVAYKLCKNPNMATTTKYRFELLFN